MGTASITRQSLAKRLGVKAATIRAWESRYRDHMESEPMKGAGAGTKKQLPQHDADVLTIVRRLRIAGHSLGEIHELIVGELATFTLEPESEPDGEPENAKMMVLAERVQSLQIALDATKQLADGRTETISALRDDLERERDSRIELERKNAALEAEKERMANEGILTRIFRR